MLSRRHVCALVDTGSDRLLVVPGASGPRLPVLDDQWPSHRDLAAAVGDPDAAVVAPPLREDDGTVVDVLTWSGHEPGLDGASWLDLADVQSLDIGADARATLVARVAELRDGAPDDGREPWFQPGWLGEVDAWVDAALARRGSTRRGPGERVKVWSLSAVVRYRVRDADGVDGDLWFKATCAGFRVEPPLTAWIAALAPDRVPRVVAVDTERAWMLLEPFAEAEGDPTLDGLRTIATAHARLQLDSRDHRASLLAEGAPDRGAEATIAALASVIHDSVERPQMSEEQVAAAARAEAWLVEQVRELHACGLPLTVVHGDLHLGNVAWADADPVVFDWTDTCVAHPYLDGRHLAKSAAHDVGPEGADAVREAYLEVWRAAYPGVDHERAWALTEVGDLVFTVISYEGIYRAQPAWARWELATVVVELLDRLVALTER